jgi:2-aminoadipate transaminase
MPGLRLGWVIGPEPVINRLVLAKQAADLHTSTLNQYLALELLNAHYLEEFVPHLIHEYKRRRDTMLGALEQHLSGAAKWTRPKGGMFLFVTLPEGMDAAKLLPRALEQRVAYVPGEEFHVDGSGKNTLRLNFSNPSPERIEEGIKRLAQVFGEARPSNL